MSRLGFSARAALLGAILLVAAARPAAGEPDPAPPAGPVRTRPTLVRALLEETIALSAGAVWYWLTPTRQLADWDFPSWQQRVTFEAWRFDNNTFATNYLWHAFGGTEFHLMGRSNGLPLAASAGLGLATSFIWEYLLEFREKVSINDVLYTTGSGVAAGEFAHWLGRYLTSSPRPGHPARVAARWTLGHMYALHAAMDGGARSPSAARTDALGFTTNIWHRFSLSTGVVVATSDGVRPAGDGGTTTAQQVRIEGDLAALPGYLAPGRWQRSFHDGNLTHIRYRGTFDGDDIDTDFYADTALVGAHTQRIGSDGTGEATSIGAGIAFLYRRERLGRFTDRLGLLHLGNLSLEERIFGDGYRLSATLRLHADFAGIESAAYPLWKRDHPDAVEKTILRKQGYYYGWGLSGRLGVELEVPPLTLGAAVFAGRYDSQEGLDRSQEDVTADVDAHDRVEDWEAWLRVGPVLDLMFLEARWLRQYRASRAGGRHAAQRLDRLAFSVGAVF